MNSSAPSTGWLELARSGRALKLVVLLGGVLLYAMNTLLAATIAPSAIRDFGGIALITWPTAAFLASSIAASSAVGALTGRIGARGAYMLAASIFGGGALICAVAGGMALLVSGRFIQGAGGGLLSGLSYVLVRSSFPQQLWARAFAAISGIWGVAVLLGPLIGGAFANGGSWRGAFYFVAVAAGLLAVGAARALKKQPTQHADRSAASSSFPLGLLALLTLSIATICAAQVSHSGLLVVALIVTSALSIVLMLQLNRRSSARLFPSDAFSFRTVAGSGLWMALLLSIANDPFSLYGPLFLQELHRLSPLSAGYLVALEALSWTLAAVLVAGFSGARERIALVCGPLIMSAGLAGIAWWMPQGTTVQLLLPIFCAGAGIGACWSFIAQRVMRAASAQEADLAASSVVTIQLYGLAFGGALAGLVANMAGYAQGLSGQATHSAAFWVPATFVSTTLAAALAAARLLVVERRARPL